MKEEKYRIKKTADFLCIVVLIGLIFSSIISYFSIPDVYWSTSQDKCVKVIHDGIESSCSELPEKYNRIWVK